MIEFFMPLVEDEDEEDEEVPERATRVKLMSIPLHAFSMSLREYKSYRLRRFDE